MIDEVAIQQTLNRYTESASRADWDEAVATFTPDGIWEIPAFGAKFQGRSTIREGIAKFMAPMEYLMQFNSPAVIKIQGDSATARATMRECAKLSGRDEIMDILGFYADKLVRTPDGWRFTHRIFELRGTSIIKVAPPNIAASPPE